MTKMLVNKFNRMLLPLGFIKNDMTWRRNHKIAFDVVGIHLERYSSGLRVNVGVYFKNLGNETNPIEEMCHIRSSLNTLNKDNSLDRYIAEYDDSEFQSGQLTDAVIGVGLPWFDVAKTKTGAMSAVAEMKDVDSSAFLDALKYGTIILG